MGVRRHSGAHAPSAVNMPSVVLRSMRMGAGLGFLCSRGGR